MSRGPGGASFFCGGMRSVWFVGEILGDWGVKCVWFVGEVGENGEVKSVRSGRAYSNVTALSLRSTRSGH